jgi:preprotein translocase subunit SecD
MKIAIITTAVLTLACQAWAIENIQLRLTYYKPEKDADRMEIVHQDQGDAIKELLFVDQKTLVDQTQITSAELGVFSDGTPRIELMLSEAGNQDLARSLQHDAGERVAVVIDGHARATGEIVREKEAGKIDLRGDFTRHEAQQVVDEINQAARQP